LCAKIKISAQETSIESSMIYAYSNESARSNNVCIPLLMLFNFWNRTSRFENSAVASTAKAGAFNQSWAQMYCFLVYSTMVENSIYRLRYLEWMWDSYLEEPAEWALKMLYHLQRRKQTWRKGIRLLIGGLWKNTGQT